uniref:Poly [ADP-ribose] polymerase n=1 Tax=Hucho hucho TaxID=62062 RepID=A0A4W5KWR4_9TELE
MDEDDLCGDDDDDSDSEDDFYDDDTSSGEEDGSSGQTGNTIEAIIGTVKVKVVCGDITKEKTDAIVSSTNSSLDLNSGVSGAILKAAGQSVVDECKALGTQPNDGVVMTKPGNIQTKHIIHMVGQTKEKEITSSMLKVLKMCEDKKIQSVSIPALGTGRCNNIFPRSWTRMNGKDLEIVTLAPNSGEYQSIEKEFVRNVVLVSLTISIMLYLQIQRIQSKDQWQRYAVKKQALDKKYPKNKNELNLYHGTTKDICQKINACGFNRSFCGRNATVYGDGTYFAKETWYSCQDAYSNPDASGLKYMYRARVLVGKPCLGVGGMKEPNPLDPTDLHQGLHDCAVNDLQNPFIYVVFCDAGAYPDYLISFKTV